MGNELSVILLNAENLFIFMDLYQGENLQNLDEVTWQKLGSGTKASKELKKVQELAEFINKENPDILALTEVGGKEALQNLALHFLKDQYRSYWAPSNSDRGIDLGFLVKNEKTHLFSIDLKSNVHRLFRHGKKKEKFSRDVLELHLKGTNNNEMWVFMLIHLKSKLPSPGDPNGTLRRASEVEALCDIYKERKAQHPNAYFIVAGDFNGQASKHQHEVEFAPIWLKTDLHDSLDLANVPQDQRLSYAHFPSFGQMIPQQIDFLLVSPNLQVIEASCLDFERPIPKNLMEKQRFPSDHYPLWARLVAK